MVGPRRTATTASPLTDGAHEEPRQQGVVELTMVVLGDAAPNRAHLRCEEIGLRCDGILGSLVFVGEQISCCQLGLQGGGKSHLDSGCRSGASRSGTEEVVAQPVAQGAPPPAELPAHGRGAEFRGIFGAPLIDSMREGGRQEAERRGDDFRDHESVEFDVEFGSGFNQRLPEFVRLLLFPLFAAVFFCGRLENAKERPQLIICKVA